MGICDTCLDQADCFIRNRDPEVLAAASCYRPIRRFKRRPQLCWSNFNWGFVVAMLVSFISVIAVIVMVGWAITMLSGCSEQSTRLVRFDENLRPTEVVEIKTSVFLREFSSSGGKLVIIGPDGWRYELTFDDHESKSSAGKVRLVHPSGVAGEVVIE